MVYASFTFEVREIVSYYQNKAMTRLWMLRTMTDKKYLDDFEEYQPANQFKKLMQTVIGKRNRWHTNH